MAGKYGSASAIFLLSGYNVLAAKLKTLTLKLTSITEPSDGLGDVAEMFAPTGKISATITQGGGFFDTSALNSHAAMAGNLATTPQATVRTGIFGCMGQSVGAVCWGLRGLVTIAYEPILTNGKLTRANAVHAVAGSVDRGQLVQPLATKTIDWNTKTLGTVVDYTLDPSQAPIPITSATKVNPCVVTTAVPHGLTTGQKGLIAGNSLAAPAINGDLAVTVISATTFSVAVDTSASTGAGTGGTLVYASSVNGAVGYQQVTAFAGFTGYVGKLRDSPDDITYTDIGAAFTNVTSAPAAEALVFAGTIDRYVCHDGDVTGAGSIDVCSALARL